jgi:hypothetical protein
MRCRNPKGKQSPYIEMSIVKWPEPRKREMGAVCFLSVNQPYIVILCWITDDTGLDGGGIFALSQIVILYEISNRIMHDLGLHEAPRLCDYFDMIGGVGTGGYAIQWQ